MYGSILHKLKYKQNPTGINNKKEQSNKSHWVK